MKQTPWTKPTMPIDAPPGTVVLYHGSCDEQVRFGASDDPRLVCKKRVRYTVDHTEIHSWHTKVFLREVAGAFPAGAFHLAPVARCSVTPSVSSKGIWMRSAARRSPRNCE